MRALWTTIMGSAVGTTLPGCGDYDEAPVPPPRTMAPSPTAGVDRAALGALPVEDWDLEVARDSFWGTWIGDHRVDRDLPPIARADVAALKARRRDLLARVT